MSRCVPTVDRSAVRKAAPNVPMLTAQEAHDFVAGIDTSTFTGLRNQAVIGLMASTGCGPQAVVRLVLGDVLQQDGLLWVRLNEREGSYKLLPCPPVPQAWLQAYLDRAALRDPDALLFRAGAMRPDLLPRRPLSQREIFSMVNEQAEAAGVQARLSWSMFRATGLSLYLANAAWTG